MATIHITRADEFINRYRAIRIFINKEEKFKLDNGETKAIDLPEGQYTIQAKIDWAGSEPLTIQLSNNQDLTLLLGSNVKRTFLTKLLSSLSFVVLFGGLFFYHDLTKEVLLAVIILWFIRDVVLTKGKSAFYYLTWGRFKYLYLKPVNPM